jgi:phage repressor protein C with HTH and peptisase S24 domain|tara:strand:- start:7789 stop:7968 length:180 start_codon:yes stop_codon:yes gene_type:complete
MNTNNKCTDVSQVLSESMELDKKDESLIFVNKMLSSVKNGDIYVVRVKEEVFIKLLKLK